jgi:hypothetical protein
VIKQRLALATPGPWAVGPDTVKTHPNHLVDPTVITLAPGIEEEHESLRVPNAV